MRAFPEILCSEGEWLSKFLPLAIFGILVYVVGTLASFSYLNWHAPGLFHTNPSFRVRYKFLIADYRPDVWWWGIAFMTRNTLLAMTNVLVPTDGHMQATIFILILTTFLIFQCILWPWSNVLINVMDTVIMAALIVMSALATYFVPKLERSSSFFSVTTFIVFLFVNIAAVASVLVALNAKRKMQKGLQAAVEQAVDRLREAGAFVNDLHRASLVRKITRLPPFDRQAIQRFLGIFELEVMGKIPGGAQQGAPTSPRHDNHTPSNPISPSAATSKRIGRLITRWGTGSLDSSKRDDLEDAKKEFQLTLDDDLDFMSNPDAEGEEDGDQGDERNDRRQHDEGENKGSKPQGALSPSLQPTATPDLQSPHDKERASILSSGNRSSIGRLSVFLKLPPKKKDDGGKKGAQRKEEGAVLEEHHVSDGDVSSDQREEMHLREVLDLDDIEDIADGQPEGNESSMVTSALEVHSAEPHAEEVHKITREEAMDV